jgi:glycerol-3-phosphate dehydrogenase
MPDEGLVVVVRCGPIWDGTALLPLARGVGIWLPLQSDPWNPPEPMKTRDAVLRSVEGETFDVCVIGAGATGSGCALDAQLRGLKTVMFVAVDFAGATSSTSTKIIHGGVRYLQAAIKGLDRAQFRVVYRALHERTVMLKNGAYLARPLEFLIPCFGWADVAYYSVGMKIYDWMAGGASLSSSHFVSREETLRRMPALESEHLVGSVAYSDGQFDDARFNIALCLTFADAGGEVLNYARVIRLGKDNNGKLDSAEIEDCFTGRKVAIRARCFVNATGPFADTVRHLASPSAAPRMRLSKGAHIVLPLELMPSRDALLIPKTEAGTVLFAIPWMGRLLVGTTEQEVEACDDLFVSKDDVELLLRRLNPYLARALTPESILSGVAGARPLVSEGDVRETKKLSRDDVCEIDPLTGLVSIMGGKWTTYRAMAEDAINAVQNHLGTLVTPSVTRNHPLSGAAGYSADYWQSLASGYNLSERTARHLAAKFGTNAPKVLELQNENAELAKPILEDLAPIRAEVVHCVRHEMALSIEDILFRRLGVQLYSWRSAIHAAPVVSAILGDELGWSDDVVASATREYVTRINRYLEAAGLVPEPFSGS